MWRARRYTRSGHDRVGAHLLEIQRECLLLKACRRSVWTSRTRAKLYIKPFLQDLYKQVLYYRCQNKIQRRQSRRGWHGAQGDRRGADSAARHEPTRVVPDCRQQHLQQPRHDLDSEGNEQTQSIMWVPTHEQTRGSCTLRRSLFARKVAI